ncbi:MAG: proline--tRNA ligase [Patescibacteria group bacterium]|jgi:prolyl-tRNA synthetase
MRYSNLFAKTQKNPPKDEVTRNAQLLVQAGYVNKLMAGVYSYLPLGLRVLNKISRIVREEMNAVGGQEVLLPALHPSEIWKQSGGWDSIDVLFKLESRTGKQYALGQSHEEVITPLAKEYIKSYKDLPVAVYQIQSKFRDELRAKSGILRGREFLMKDMYSWHRDQADFERFYDTVKRAYLKVFERCGLTAKSTEASGGAFTQKISYEFMVLTPAGEDDILFCDNCDYCVNVEITDLAEGGICKKCGQGVLGKARASEVGNVFDLGQKYSKDFGLELINENGKKFYPIMGCYGIGISRLLGVIVEKHSDSKGIIWPESVAPFQTHLIGLGNDPELKTQANNVYEKMLEANIEVLFDDRADVGAGQKFADADLIGNPVRLVVSPRTGGKIEWKRRDEEKTELISLEEIVKRLS